MRELISLSTRVVVMAERGRQMLQDIYEVPLSKVDLIAHGIPDVGFVDPTYFKDQFGVEGKVVLLTFGLLSPNKGIEVVLNALPAIQVFLALLNAIPERECFGVQYDPSNAIVAGDDPVDLLRCVADRVVSVHASDRYLVPGTTLDELRQADGTLGYSPNLRHGVTGRGLNDYHAIFRILAEQGYSGWISIEDGMNGMEEMADSLAFLRRMSERYFA